ncbi:uncharacterized protein K489DRAFT_32925 [Dissoconium aciculare CBS 342.82]|uniref:Uncharacterized protein n=1 Tax=Dissoconium aciculare CBS 342.82 TaxID=1314786 RepID=A0A6J3M0M2_9PEZI|nr:uncharacterized protein K489DRAFT_32925 [Dissoconium aciculare CBS 342.82]KAF1820447.1 hypothetical protein K489DRAFT_32925 [Dissoconium aciculare CBS 342.82]
MQTRRLTTLVLLIQFKPPEAFTHQPKLSEYLRSTCAWPLFCGQIHRTWNPICGSETQSKTVRLAR